MAEHPKNCPRCGKPSDHDYHTARYLPGCPMLYNKQRGWYHRSSIPIMSVTKLIPGKIEYKQEPPQ